MNSLIKSQRFVIDIEPNIALARAECFEKYRKRSVSEVVKTERAVRAIYLRDLLDGLTEFLKACLPFGRSAAQDLSDSADLQPSISAAPSHRVRGR